jgi:MSHA pilin protein MshD
MSRRYDRGFTLIELIIFIVVVGAGMAGILSVSTTVVKSSADPMVRKQALTLADSILEEVLQKEYTDPDGTSGETTRATMDDVDDYNGKTQALFTDWPVSLSGYLVTISVAAPAALGGTVTVQAKKVTVVVTRGPESVTLVGYRAQY